MDYQSGLFLLIFLLNLFYKKAITEFMKCMVKLKDIQSELLSKALGLSSDYLAGLDCLSFESMVCNYYPICREPELTLGAPKHSDPFILTIFTTTKKCLLQKKNNNNNCCNNIEVIAIVYAKCCNKI